VDEDELESQAQQTGVGIVAKVTTAGAMICGSDRQLGNHAARFSIKRVLIATME
jgi:hypothetical protein